MKKANAALEDKKNKQIDNLKGCLQRFKEGRWFPLVIAIGIVTVVAIVMALLGWRITYAPGLENSWDAISAVAAWIGALMAIPSVTASFLAVRFAILVPKEIAKEQNKIALLEKRLDIFKKIEEYIGIMDLWQYNYGWFQKLLITESEIELLFDKEFADFYVDLERESAKIDMLWGDYKHAERHGDCHGRHEEEIGTEIQDKVACIRESFKVIKEKMYSKYLYI